MAPRIIITLLRGLAASTLLAGSVQCAPAQQHSDISLAPREDANASYVQYAGASGYRTVVYFPNWDIYGRNFQPNNLPADKLTHVLYSFANVHSDTGEVYLSDTYADTDKHYPTDSWNDSGNNVYGCAKQLYLLKKKNRQMKVLLSIGGWTYSSNFAGPMSTAAGRAKFAQSAVQLLMDMGFDGLDIDWEYPADAGQASNMVDLLAATRNALTNYSSTVPGKPHFLLTVATAAGPDNFHKLNVAQMDPYLDFWNLMAYDYSGSFSTAAAHQGNLYASSSNPASTPFNTDDAVKYYLQSGVASNKLVLGMPLYGHAFESTQGPGKPFSGVGSGSWENGIWDYKVLPQSGAQVFYDSQIVASWSYDSSKQTMVSYDSPQAAAAKFSYIKTKALGGGMWWESNGDLPETASGSLIASGASALGSLDTTQNVLDYPQSKYDNMRAGMPGE